MAAFAPIADPQAKTTAFNINIGQCDLTQPIPLLKPIYQRPLHKALS
jgi:hypothetical protein